MRIAVARRPVEPFDTEVVLPEWQLEGDDDAWFGAPEDGGLVDENGMPIELPGAAPPPEAGEAPPPPVEDGPVLNQPRIEEPTGRRPPTEPGDQTRRAPRRESGAQYGKDTVGAGSYKHTNQTAPTK